MTNTYRPADRTGLSRARGWAVPVGGVLFFLAGASMSRLLARSHPVQRAAAAPRAQRSIRYPEEGPFPRLQERVLSQLGFVNNLLITLAVAVLAFAANALADHAELRALGWRRWLLTSGLI